MHLPMVLLFAWWAPACFYVTPPEWEAANDRDGDGFWGPAAGGEDCDDEDEAVNPEAVEACNGVDDDCDGTVDGPRSADASTWYADTDGDGFGDSKASVLDCQAPEGHVAQAGDCDDTDATTSPDAQEVCNGVDDDCDGEADGATASDALPWYADGDGDGFGDASQAVKSCEMPAGYASEGTDCDDGDAEVHPGAAEVCNGVDDDCDDAIDEDPVDAPTWYLDADADGAGNLAVSTQACDQPGGYQATGTDCDDGDAAIRPLATELCNGLDDNCDGVTDEGDAADAPTWYADTDGDGYGNLLVAEAACEAPEGFVDSATDCDDGDPEVHPLATEHCNEVDDDCDAVVDETDAADALIWYRDGDGDGWGDPTAGRLACTLPSGHVADATDCDDTRADISPSALELCNGRDDDCDDIADEADAADAPTWYADADGDGYGNLLSTTTACTRPGGWLATATDCDDGDADAHPGGIEVCDGDDDDCDGVVDEPDALDAPTWYADADGDGFGDALAPQVACDPPEGHVADATDCDDTRADISPASDEVCDGSDDDCDGVTDEPDALDAPTWYADADGDGFGDALAPQVACDPPESHVADATDCDDTLASVSPTSTEVCDHRDDDCDGVTDEPDAADAPTWYRDADGDGYGNLLFPEVACDVPGGYAALATDCHDGDPEVHPLADERCNGVDDDCDGEADGPHSIDATAWYADLDGDGWGDPATETRSCTPPEDHVTNATDCDDSDAAISPAAKERCNSLDDDCDGAADSPAPTWYVDGDGDGWGDASVPWSACPQPAGFAAESGDCDDGDPALGAAFPWYYDGDDDGHGDPEHFLTSCDGFVGYVTAGTDCDDDDATIRPGAAEICDSADNDCDGTTDEDPPTWYRDTDGDGWGGSVSLSTCTPPSGFSTYSGDCDESDASVNPGAAETWYDGVDADCDGADDDDADGDGYKAHGVGGDDCDDGDGAVSPAAREVCRNGKDDDCDGYATGCAWGEVGLETDLGEHGVKVSGAAARAYLGTSVALTDDMNDDGMAEMVVGAPDDSSYAGSIGGGFAYLFLSPQSAEVDLGDASARVYSCTGSTWDDVGNAVANAGDVDGDGYGDILVGDSNEGSTYNYGSANLFLGPMLGDYRTCADTDARMLGESSGDKAGYGVAGNGDVNGDGFGDLLVGAPERTYPAWYGAAYLVEGPVTGYVSLSGADGRFYAEANETLAGRAVDFAGDVDGDGLDDFLVGGPGYDMGYKDLGAVWLFLSPVSGFAYLSTADARVEGTYGEEDLGTAVSGAGDVDGDGLDDIVMGAASNRWCGYSYGTASVFLSPISGELKVTAADARFYGENAWSLAGNAVDGVGDMNGDGLDDIVVGADQANTGGVAYLLLAPMSGTESLLGADARFVGEVTNGGVGRAIAGGGDADGDGLNDILIGAYYGDFGGEAHSGAAYLVLGGYVL